MKYVIKNHVTPCGCSSRDCHRYLRFKLGLLLNLIAYARLTCSVYQGIPCGWEGLKPKSIESRVRYTYPQWRFEKWLKRQKTSFRADLSPQNPDFKPYFSRLRNALICLAQWSWKFYLRRPEIVVVNMTIILRNSVAIPISLAFVATCFIFQEHLPLEGRVFLCRPPASLAWTSCCGEGVGNVTESCVSVVTVK